jgi:hypothetical protein
MDNSNKEWLERFFPRLTAGASHNKYVSEDQWEAYANYLRGGFRYGDLLGAGREELAGYLLILANVATLPVKAISGREVEMLASVIRQLLQARISQEEEKRSVRFKRWGMLFTIVVAVATCVQAYTAAFHR